MLIFNFDNNEYQPYAKKCHGKMTWIRHIPSGKYIENILGYLTGNNNDVYKTASFILNNDEMVKNIINSDDKYSDFVFTLSGNAYIVHAYRADFDPPLSSVFDELATIYSLSTKIEEITFSDRINRCFEDEKIFILGQVAIQSEAEIKGIKNLGDSSFEEINRILNEKNLQFGMSNYIKIVEAFAKPYFYDIAIDQLTVSDRTRKCLEEQNILNLGSLSRLSSEEVKGIKNLSKSSYEEIEKILSDHGLELADPSHKEMDTAKQKFYYPLESSLG